MKKSTMIVELFEDLLDSKGIDIPCEDQEEEMHRHDDDNCARLYGMEYWKLIDQIEEILDEA